MLQLLAEPEEQPDWGKSYTKEESELIPKLMHRWELAQLARNQIWAAGVDKEGISKM